jgi:predicted Zn-dependent protease
VLAHEMGHQYYRHPLRALGRTVVISLALMVISGTESDTLVQNFVGNAAIVTGLSFNRDQEREADRTGINLLLNHYGHASGSGEFFEAIKQQSETDFELPAFLSTHPGVDERIEMLQSHSRRTSGDKTTIPEVIALYLEYISNQNQETDHD